MWYLFLLKSKPGKEIAWRKYACSFFYLCFLCIGRRRTPCRPPPRGTRSAPNLWVESSWGRPRRRCCSIGRCSRLWRSWGKAVEMIHAGNSSWRSKRPSDQRRTSPLFRASGTCSRSWEGHHPAVGKERLRYIFLKNVFNFDLIDLVVAHPLVGVGHGRVAPPDGGGSYEMCERKIQCKKG